MPGRNGMGPLGNGPMTGRGMGNCNSNGKPNVQGMGQGRGCGMGLGRGRGRGNGQGVGNRFNANNLAQPKQDELTILKQQAEVINKRISELEEKE